MEVMDGSSLGGFDDAHTAESPIPKANHAAYGSNHTIIN